MGAGWIIAWRIATRNIGLLSTLILVRLLQPADFGLVALASGFINSVDALSAIGVQDALVRTAALDRTLYDTGFTLGVLRGSLTALLIAALAWPVGIFFDEPRLAVVMVALSAGALISGFENIGIVDFRRDFAFRKEFDLQLWSRLLGGATTVLVAAVWHSYWALVVGILIYRLARLLQTYLMSPYRPCLTLRAWRRIIGFSMWTWAQTILYQARDRVDSIFIGRWLGAAQVGAFSVGLELGLLPTTELVEPLGRALFSGFATLHNASGALGNMFRGAVGLGFMLVLPAGLGISMIADPMVRLCLGQHWLAAVPVIQIMGIGGTTTIFIQTCANLLNVIGQPNITFYIGAISTMVKLAGLLLLLPRYGLCGAAMALMLSGATDLLLLLRFALRRTRVSVSEIMTVICRPTLATAIMVSVLWLLGDAWTPGSGTDSLDLARDLIARSVIGAASYIMVLGLVWVIARQPEGAERFLLTMTLQMWRRVVRTSASTYRHHLG